VNIDDLLVSQPDSGEQALEICETLVRSAALDVVVIDSVAALVPRAEISVVAKSNTTLIFINQIRLKIGVMFGNPETTSGGRALKFYSSIRMDIRRIGSIKDGDEIIGNRTRVKVVKNKVAAPFKNAEFDIIYGHGISREGELIDLGVQNNIVDKAGSWFSYGETRLGQGRENAKKFLMENIDFAADIDRRLRETYGLIPTPVVEVIEGETEPAAKAGPVAEGEEVAVSE